MAVIFQPRFHGLSLSTVIELCYGKSDGRFNYWIRNLLNLSRPVDGAARGPVQHENGSA